LEASALHYTSPPLDEGLFEDWVMDAQDSVRLFAAWREWAIPSSRSRQSSFETIPPTTSLPSSAASSSPTPTWLAAPVRWRSCGPPGAVHIRGLVANRFRASILGVSGISHRSRDYCRSLLPAEESLPSLSIEVSLFVTPSAADKCTYVDGQRLFQTFPLTYLAAWTCDIESSLGLKATSSSSSVVSYAGSIAQIRCDFDDTPTTEEDDDRSEKEEWFLTLRPSEPVLAESGWLIEKVPICKWQSLPALRPQQEHPLAQRVPGPPPSWGLTVCSEVLYGLTNRYRQGVVLEWLEYHRLIGVNHMVLYDADGCLEGDLLEPYILTGFVTYFPRFPRSALSEAHFAIHTDQHLPSHAAPDAQAAAHCLSFQRGLTEWVAFLHSPDEFLSSGKGLRNVQREIVEPLRPLRDEGLAVVDVPAIYFTHGPELGLRESPYLPGRYIYRSSKPIELPKWGSTRASTLNRFPSPLANPDRVGELVTEHFPRAKPGSLYLDDVPQDFLRANHYGETFRIRPILQRGSVWVRDESILWVEDSFLRLGLPPLAPGPVPTGPAVYDT